MGASYRNNRLTLFVLSVLCAGIAVTLSSQMIGEVSVHRVSGLYYSELLDDEVSIPALLAISYSDEFQSLVGGRVQVDTIKESPFHIQVTTEQKTKADLLNAHKRAIHLLSVEIKEQALSDVRGDLKYLDEVRKKAEKLGQARLEDEARMSRPKTEQYLEVLSTKDSSRVVFLREEINKIEAFLEGQPLPKTVRAQLDRNSLNAAEKRVRTQQEELSRLAKLFHPSSKAVQAQSASLEQARTDLAEIERQLAEVYLRALKIELETLDDKASSRIRDGLSSRKLPRISNEDQAKSSASNWMDDRQKELEKRADAISSAASLKLEGSLSFAEHEATNPYWVALNWAGSLTFFLLALFSSRGQEKKNILSGPDTNNRRHANSQSSTHSPSIRLELPVARSEFAPDRMERFFDEIWNDLSENLKHSARKLLVLGDTDTDTDTRLSFSIRLANSLGRRAQKVRLIDFDFHKRSLSERLGRQELPGVSELMLEGGPVDEFFSSIAGTRIQFAPAGKSSSVEIDAKAERLSEILATKMDEITILDASTGSPLHLLTNQVDGVLWATANRRALSLTESDSRALSSLRTAGIPIWGISIETMEIYPLL